VIIFLLAFLLIIGAGFAVGLAFLALAGMLAAIGIISSSFAIAVLNRSATAGFKSLMILSLAVAGAPAGVASVWLVAEAFQLPAPSFRPILLGAAGGVAAGILIAAVFIYATQLLGRLIREKIARLSQPTPDENSDRPRLEHR
jgi:hypothetical protein